MRGFFLWFMTNPTPRENSCHSLCSRGNRIASCRTPPNGVSTICKHKHSLIHYSIPRKSPSSPAFVLEPSPTGWNRDPYPASGWGAWCDSTAKHSWGSSKRSQHQLLAAANPTTYNPQKRAAASASEERRPALGGRVRTKPLRLVERFCKRAVCVLITA